MTTARNPYANPPQEDEGWSHLDGIPTGNWRPEKRDRDREWEASNRAYSYRSVDPKINHALLELAEDLMVSVSDVADVFIRYGLACIERGELQVQSRIKPQSRRMTLINDDEDDWQEASWNQTPPTKKKRRKKAEQDDQEQLWKQQVGYRVQPETHAALRKLAKAHNVSSGDVITLLCGHSLNAYQSGKLILNPRPVTVKMTLKGS
ncbi:MAG: hypothetical protein U9Q82_02965 [Chloroflexota bacterium]|nr:hypothetical protein [Chloroflexota bacterium]